MKPPRIATALALLLAAGTTAQSPLTTLFADNNQGGTNATVYFDLTPAAPGVTVSQIDANLHEAAAVGAVEVWIIQGASATTGYGNPGAWTLHCTSPVIGDAPGVPVPILLDPPLSIAGGTTCGVALCGLGVGHRYTNYNATTGVPAQTYSNPDLILASKGIATGRFGSGTTTRVVNVAVYYAPSAGAVVATSTQLGQGCGPLEYASLYEWFGYYSGTPQLDLANASMWFVPTGGGGYTVLPGPSYNAVGSLAAATPVVLTENSVAAVGTLGLYVSDNGFVARAAGNSGSMAASNFNWTSLLRQPATAFYFWHNYSATLGGTVWYEESGTQAQITFDGVFNASGLASGPSFFQFQIDVPSGLCALVTGAIGTDTTSYIVGYSPGGPSADPGATDISAALAGGIMLGATDVLQPTLRSRTRPVLGTTWTQSIENIPATSFAAFFALGFADPGILDLGVIGAPGCQLRTTPVWSETFTPSGSTRIYSFGVNSPALVGIDIFTQAGTLDVPPRNALGVITTAGVKSTLGLQ